MKRNQVLAFVALAAATFVTTAWAGAYKYSVPANINLVMNRDAVATVSAGYNPNGPRFGADDSRNIAFTAPATSCWWKIDLQQPYKIDRYRVEFFTDPGFIAATNFAFQTSVDGSAWTTHFSYANRTPTAYVYAGTIPGGAVDARYFRIECFGYNNATYGMIVNRVDLWGPNNPDVSTNICVGQMTWNASDTSDTYNSDSLLNEDVIQGGYLGAPASALPISPEIYLDRDYIIRTLAFCNWGDTRSVKDLDIYGRVGGEWVKIKEIRGLSAATKLPQEFAMDTAVYTDALRYTILSNHGAADVILMLNLIYAEPPPDAAVMQTE